MAENRYYLCVSSNWKRSLEDGHIAEQENRYFFINEKTYKEWETDPPVPDEDYSGGTSAGILCRLTEDMSETVEALDACGGEAREKLLGNLAAKMGELYVEYSKVVAPLEREIQTARKNVRMGGLEVD